ncbi:MAG TPA: aldo/keto reductase, partial [Candidatus Olsenella pullicola]|nr:aldo/keto reductase [Candidatus Olsenella pullicola]
LERAFINFFDTANVYAQGRSEEIVGKAIKPTPYQSVTQNLPGGGFSWGKMARVTAWHQRRETHDQDRPRVQVL